MPQPRRSAPATARPRKTSAVQPSMRPCSWSTADPFSPRLPFEAGGITCASGTIDSCRGRARRQPSIVGSAEFLDRVPGQSSCECCRGSPSCRGTAGPDGAPHADRRTPRTGVFVGLAVRPLAPVPPATRHDRPPGRHATEISKSSKRTVGNEAEEAARTRTGAPAEVRAPREGAPLPRPRETPTPAERPTTTAKSPSLRSSMKVEWMKRVE